MDGLKRERGLEMTAALIPLRGVDAQIVDVPHPVGELLMSFIPDR